MGPDLVTVLWISEDPIPANDEIHADPHVELVQVPVADAAVALKQARVHGGVVTVAKPGDMDQLLAFGADETLDVYAITEPSLRCAVQTARARAAARLEVPHLAMRPDNTPDGAGLALLASAIGHRMSESVRAALRTCITIEHGYEEPGANVGAAVADLRRELQRADELSQSLVALARPADAGMCNAAEVVLQVAELVRSDVERFARLGVDVPNHSCIIPIGRATALNLVSSLVRNAMEAFDRSASLERGSIGLRVSVKADLVVLEVSDNGGTFDPEARCQALDPTIAVHRAGALGLGLALAAGHVRSAGGEVFIDSDPELGTTVRIFFPASSTLLRRESRTGPAS
jgi:signal transduction histidine kinase